MPLQQLTAMAVRYVCAHRVADFLHSLPAGVNPSVPVGCGFVDLIGINGELYET